MSKCRMICGNGSYVEISMHLTVEDIIIAFDFTNHNEGFCYRIDYGCIAIKKDIICYTVIIDALNNTDNAYNEKRSYMFDNLTNFEIRLYTSYNGVQMRLSEIKTHKLVNIFNIVECDKQKYYDYFIEALQQMK